MAAERHTTHTWVLRAHNNSPVTPFWPQIKWIKLDTPNACYLCHPFLLGEKQVSRRATRYLNIRESSRMTIGGSDAMQGPRRNWDMHRALGACNDKNFFLEISRIESDDGHLTAVTWALGAHHGRFSQNESSHTLSSWRLCVTTEQL